MIAKELILVMSNMRSLIIVMVYRSLKSNLFLNISLRLYSLYKNI